MIISPPACSTCIFKSFELIIKPCELRQYTLPWGHLRGSHLCYVVWIITKDDLSSPLLQVRRCSVLPLFQTRTMRYGGPAFFPSLFAGWGGIDRAWNLQHLKKHPVNLQAFLGVQEEGGPSSPGAKTGSWEKNCSFLCMLPEQHYICSLCHGFLHVLCGPRLWRCLMVCEYGFLH